MKVLASYNIKGGVGKTAGAVNLAYQAAREGRRTLLWDLDPQGAASWYFRIEARVKGGSERLLRKKRALSKAIRASDYEGLDLVPADFSYRDLDLDLNATGKARQKLAQLLETVREGYDIVVLDCPPSISLLSESVFRASDALLVPTIPTVLSLRTLEQLAQHMKARKDAPLLLPYFCLVDRRKRAHKDILEQAHDADLGFLETAIPYSAQVENMGAERRPVIDFAPRSAPARCFVELWREIEQRLAAGDSARLRRKRLRAIYKPQRRQPSAPVIELRDAPPTEQEEAAAPPEKDKPAPRSNMQKSSTPPPSEPGSSEPGSSEIEFKFALDGPQDFDTLSRALGHPGKLPQAVRQTNRFADTADRALAGAELVLRLRGEGGKRIVTTKGPTLEQSADGTLTRKAEEEVVFDEKDLELDPVAALRALVEARGETPLVKRLVDIVGVQPLEWIGTFVNDRRKLGPVQLPGTEVAVVFELDTTRFPGNVLEYEAEVELPARDVEVARAALERLFDEAGLPRRSAPSKAKRFFARLGEQRG